MRIRVFALVLALLAPITAHAQATGLCANDGRDWRQFDVAIPLSSGPIVWKFVPATAETDLNQSFGGNRATDPPDLVRAEDSATFRSNLFVAFYAHLRAGRFTCDQLYRLMQIATERGVDYYHAPFVGGVWTEPKFWTVYGEPHLFDYPNASTFQMAFSLRQWTDGVASHFAQLYVPGPRVTDSQCAHQLCDAGAVSSDQVVRMLQIVLE